MTNQPLFTIENEVTRVELTYDADKSLMPAKDLGEAILGMTTCLKMAGRATKIDFEDVYIFAIEEGSVRTFFVYVRRNKDEIIADVATNVVAMALFGALTLFGQWGISAFKKPTGEMLTGVQKEVVALCLSSDFRRSVSKVAKPLSEVNKKVTIKFGDKGFEITCDTQEKFLNDEEDPILPELQNGATVSLPGTLTRMNMVPKNDLGFLYNGRTITLQPIDSDKNVAQEFHQFTPLPIVIVTGIVVRESLTEVPRLKVIRMDEPPKNDQLQLGITDSQHASDSAQPN